MANKMKIQWQDCKKEFTLYGKSKRTKLSTIVMGHKQVPSNHIAHDCKPKENK